jgi:hypothetical protein
LLTRIEEKDRKQKLLERKDDEWFTQFA